jgi:hypothetical protein
MCHWLYPKVFSRPSVWQNNTGENFVKVKCHSLLKAY